MDQLNTIQQSLEDLKATNEANMNLYNDAHEYPDEVIEKPPNNLINVKRDKDNIEGGVIRLRKGKIIRTKQDSNSELENIVGNQDNLKLIEMNEENVEKFTNYSNNNYYLLLLLFLLLLILLLK